MGKRGSGLSDAIHKTLHGNKAVDKEAGRSRKDREKEKIDKKKGGAGGGKQGGGNKNEKATTASSSNLHTAVPGQIKIAKRPAADTVSDSKTQNKGGVALPDLGQRSEVKIQLKQGGGNEPNKTGNQSSNAGGPNTNKGKSVKEDRGGRGNSANGNNQKPAKADGLKGETLSADKKRDGNDRQGQAGQQPKKETEPGATGQGRRARPAAANLLGGRNLLTAALKSSTRDTSATPSGNPDGTGATAKGGRNRDRGAKAGGATGTAGPGAVMGKDTAAGGQNGPAANEGGGVAGGEKARRPPRNRNRKAGGGGDGKPDASQAGAGIARIDA